MKRENMQDERVSAQQRKINSEAYSILMLVLLVSILVQQFFLNAPFEQYAAEFICFFGMSLYMIIRYMMVGLNLYGEGKSAKYLPIINSLVVGITVTMINGVLNFSKYGNHYKEDGIGYFIATLFVTFISASISVFVLMSLLDHMNKKKQARIQKQLDEAEESD